MSEDQSKASSPQDDSSQVQPVGDAASPGAVESQTGAQPASAAQQPVGGDAQPTGPQPVAGASQPADSRFGAAAPQPPVSPYGAAPQPPISPYSAMPQPPFPPNGGMYGQPMPGYGQPPVAVKSGKAIGALVCGILAILFAGLPLIGIILGVVAIVLASKAVKEAGRDGKATGGKVCGIIGIVFSVIAFILYLVISMSVYSYVANHPGSVYSSSSGSIYDEGSVYDDSLDGSLFMSDADKAAEAAAKAEFDKLKAADDKYVQWIASEADEEMRENMGCSLAEMGVDPSEMAHWLLTDFDYATDGAYAYEIEGEANVYVDVQARDWYQFLGVFYAKVDQLTSSSEMDTMDEAAVKERLGQLCREAMNEATELGSYYAAIEVEFENGAWAVEWDSMEDEMEYMFGL